MDNKLFTLIEVAVIAGLIIFVLWLGGVFTSAPLPTLQPTAASPLTPTATPSITVTRRPTPTATPVTPTPTHPPLTTPQGLIAFESTRDGNSEIYIMNADGSGQLNLTNHSAQDFSPFWSPAGERIFFLSTRTGWQEIYSFKPDGSDLQQVSHTFERGLAYQPPVSWSGDGRQFLAVGYSVWNTGHSPGSTTLDVVESDGSGVKTLMQETTSYIGTPRWSPDGRYIALNISRNNASCEIYLGERAGEGYEFLATSQFCGTYAWQPDSGRLAVSNGSRVFFLNPDTLSPESFINSIDNYHNVIDWSPDQRYLLLTGPNANDSEQTLWLYDSIANAQIRLDKSLTISYESADVSWSPESQWLTYYNRRLQGNDIYIVNIYASDQPLQLTTGGHNFSPQWQP